MFLFVPSISTSTLSSSTDTRLHTCRHDPSSLTTNTFVTGTGYRLPPYKANVNARHMKRNETIECKRSSRSSRSSSRSSTSQSSLDNMLFPSSSSSSYSNDGRRRNRVGELIKREVGLIIDNLFHCDYNKREEENNVLLISVVNVKCSPDLKKAHIYLSVMMRNSTKDEKEEMKDIFNWLKDSKKEIRYRLANTVHLKFIPDLSFHQCEMQQATNTVNVLNQLERERQQKQKQEQQQDDNITLDAHDDLDYNIDVDTNDNNDGLIFDDDDDDDDDDGEVMIVDVESEDEEEKKMKTISK